MTRLPLADRALGVVQNLCVAAVLATGFVIAFDFALSLLPDRHGRDVVTVELPAPLVASIRAVAP